MTFLNYKPLKLYLRVFLAGHTVAMITYYVMKRTTTCSRLEILKRAFSRVGAKIWNEMPASLRELPKKHFQTKLHSFLLDTLMKHDDYIDISQITSALKTYK